MLIPLTGALAGLFHVLSGPDHLAALAPLAVEGRTRAWAAGWSWGMGHTAGVVTVALLAVLLREALPPVETVSAWSERLVGGALIGIGLWALRHSARVRPFRHRHGQLSHDHIHVQAGPTWFRRLGHVHASFCMGVLHGIAGTSHFFGVLPALAMPGRGASLLYIGAFGVGTIAAMTAFAAIVGNVAARVPDGAGAYRMMMGATAILAIVVGGIWLTAPLA